MGQAASQPAEEGRPDARWVRMLAFDPGERNLGVTLVTYDGATGDPLNDEHYHVRWWALWDLKAAEGHDGSRNASLESLVALVAQAPVVADLLYDPRVHVTIEHQEGFDFNQPELGAALMPMCTIAGALYALFRLYGHDVRLVGKKSKWGWSTYIHTPGYERLSRAQKRERRKYCITLYVRDLIRRQAANAEVGAAGMAGAAFGTPAFFRCAAGKMMQNRFDALAFEDQAHMCDGAVQAMFALRRLFRVSPANTLRNREAWAPLEAKACAAVPAPADGSSNQGRTKAAAAQRAKKRTSARPRPTTGTGKYRARKRPRR